MQAKQQARSCHLFALRLTRPLAVALALQQASGPWAEAEAMATAVGQHSVEWRAQTVSLRQQREPPLKLILRSPPTLALAPMQPQAL
jgi:hypothetical protein